MLLAIEAGMGHADDLLREEPLMARMSDADRRLTTTLVLGVLRWQIHLDQAVRRLLAKPKTKFDPSVLIALRLGAFQLLHLDRIPPHAAIDESVELVKHSRVRSAAGLVNAVLRKMADRVEERDPEDTQTRALAAHPAWMVERWTRFFGLDTAAAICLHDQQPPSTAIRLASAAEHEELAAAGVTLASGRLLTAARLVESGDVMATTAFREGRVRIQDEGSQLVAELAASLSQESKRILDCCAAPGGKTLILAERNPSAQIIACESSPGRLSQLRERLSALARAVECKLADATVLHMDAEVDLALADVPCSGTGTLSRNPEIRHRLTPEDLPRQAERQRAILTSALRAIRPGGRVVYSTCSLEPEENEEVAQSVVREVDTARIVSLGPTIETLGDRGILSAGKAQSLHSCLSTEGILRLMPGAYGTDGFFIAMLERHAGAR